MCKQKAPKRRRYTCHVQYGDGDVSYQKRFHMRHKTDEHAFKWAKYLASGEGVTSVALSYRHNHLGMVQPDPKLVAIRITPAPGVPKYKRGEQFVSGEKYICRASQRNEYGKIVKKIYRMRHVSESSACSWAEHLLSLPGIVHVKVTGVLGGKAGESRDFKRENS